MTLQLVGAARLARLMQADRLRNLDTGWLLFGPHCDEELADEEPALEPYRYAAE